MEQKLRAEIRNRQKIYIHNDQRCALFQAKVEKRATQNDLPTS
jgi:hypothetical protein